MKIKKIASCMLALALMVTFFSYIAPEISGNPEKALLSTLSADKFTGSGAVVDKSENTYIEISPESLGKLQAKDDDIIYNTPEEDIVKINENMGYIDDQILIFFKSGTSLSAMSEVIKSVDGKVAGYTAMLNQWQIKIAPKSLEELKAVCDALMAYDAVELASPNISIKHSSAAIVPSDPWQGSYTSWSEKSPGGDNWWLEAVQAQSAWEYNEYMNLINIGIVDAGFETDHEDLQGKISFPKNWLKNQNRSDNHGNHVAGIISANANNGVGITGLCWNAKLTCVDWEPEENQYWLSGERIFTGLSYAVKAGAKVINFSIGSTGSYPEDAFSRYFFELGMEIESKLFSYSMAYLLKNHDFIVVQSAGNGNMAGYSVDASINGCFSGITEKNAYTGMTGTSKKDVCDRIIIVGSAQLVSGNKYIQSSFSNGGTQVDISAPGSALYSCYKQNLYGYMSGTSMAAPVVTAITAMVWSVNPDFTGAEVRDIVCDPENTCYTVEDNPSEYHPTVDTYRLINAKLSVEAAMLKTYGTLNP